MIDTIIWDWNGTLLDDVDVCIASVNRLLARRGLPSMNRVDYHRMFTFPVQVYYEDMGFDFDTESFKDVAVEFHDAYEDLVGEAPLHVDAVEVLGSLRSRGIQQVVLSALEQIRLENELKVRRINHYFGRIYGLPDLEAVSKIERGRELLAILNADPTRCCLVGDTEHDAEVANELGVRCVLVSCGHNPPAKLKKTGLPVFGTLQDAVNHLDVRR